jgi:peptidoglycan/LPS O-acetylase OafA/YrhL
MGKKDVYFPNLTALRFFAALLVFISHAEQIKSALGFENIYKLLPFRFGTLGVALFFVLSGFLITYLLLKEKEVYTSINIKDFYLRRVLRIWPLYFLLILLGYVILPNIDILHFEEYSEAMFSWKNIFLVMLVLPNMAIPVPFISQIWSVGVEEQFYLVWPWLVKKGILKTVIAFGVLIGLGVGLYTVLNNGGSFMHSYFSNAKACVQFVFINKFHLMVFGGIMAYLYFIKSQILNIFYHKIVQILTLVGLGLLMWKANQSHNLFIIELYGILFAILIVNLATNPKNILKLEFKPINYLGKISFGFYMYHIIGIVIILKLIPGVVDYYLFYPLSFGLTVLLSYLSYEYFEKAFLKLKSSFTRLKSYTTKPE